MRVINLIAQKRRVTQGWQGGSIFAAIPEFLRAARIGVNERFGKELEVLRRVAEANAWNLDRTSDTNEEDSAEWGETWLNAIAAGGRL